MLVLSSVPMRALGVVATAVSTITFVPLGLVLPPTRWVAALTFAGIVASMAVVGFVKARPMAFAAPFVLLVVWFLFQ